jgi:alkylation response protein AidB-like acyl-CoA dehydrogenase
MLTYEPPIDEFEFAINSWLNAPEEWSQNPDFSGLDRAATRQILEEAGRFACERLLPINARGDLEGCRFDGSAVHTPPGYREAYRSFVESGWPALSCAPEHGGQALPQVLNAALYEMLNATCHGWTMYPGLAHGAYECLRAHGSATLQSLYLPKLVSGEWLATMCLSESNAGSDLGLLRTKAEPATQPDMDGRYYLTGTKIFISGGEHDLTENIIHLVLARLPDAPTGTKGLSLFLVPKLIPTGPRLHPNKVRCVGIENKMGIKGSATCTLSFEGASGWLVGQPHRGLAAMFVIMNAARLQVALQGLGHAEITHQNAMQYAMSRRQSRSALRRGSSAVSADRICQHPAIQQLLLEQRSIVRAQRILALWIAHMLDTAQHHGNAQRQQQCLDWASLLTPTAKAMFTANGFELASTALQIFGGYGYIREAGLEQAVRDARIAMIYEGTNEIQAIDLIQRKVLADRGQVLRSLLQEFSTEAGACASIPECAQFGAELQRVVESLTAVVASLVKAAPGAPDLAQRVAADFLWATGRVVLAYVHAKVARLTQPRKDIDQHHAERFKLAQYYYEFLLPAFDHDVNKVRILANSTFEFPWPQEEV